MAKGVYELAYSRRGTGTDCLCRGGFWRNFTEKSQNNINKSIKYSKYETKNYKTEDLLTIMFRIV